MKFFRLLPLLLALLPACERKPDATISSQLTDAELAELESNTNTPQSPVPNQNKTLEPELPAKSLPLLAFLPANASEPFTRVQTVVLGRISADNRNRPESHFQIGVFDAQSNPTRQLAHVQGLMSQKPLGVIIEPIQATPELGAALQLLIDQGVPVCILGRAIPGAKMATVLREDPAALAELVAAKCQKLLEVLSKSLKLENKAGRIMVVRQTGEFADTLHQTFTAALASERGIEIAPVLESPNTEIIAKDIVLEALRGGAEPAIIFAHTDIMALGAAQALEQQRLQDEVAVIGMDGVGGSDGGLRLVMDGIFTATIRRPYLVDEAYRLIQANKGRPNGLPAEFIGKARLVDSANAREQWQEATTWLADLESLRRAGVTAEPPVRKAP